VGVDLGATTITAVVVSDGGLVMGRLSEKLAEDRSPEVIADQLAGAVEAVRVAAGVLPGALTGIGVGSPGGLDCDMGVVRVAANFPLWDHVHLCAMVEASMEVSREGSAVPVVLENDANAALLAEVWCGAAANKTNAAMITLGSGIGGAAVVDGNLLRGSTSMAGEIGHAIVERNGVLNEATGVHGISEEYASAGGLGRQARRRVQDMREAGTTEHSSLCTLALDSIDCKAVFEHADRGDAVAQELLDTAMDILGVLVINVCRFYDPEVIVMTGGMTLAGDALFEKVRTAVARHHWNIQAESCTILPAQCGNDAGAIGAAYAAKLKKA